MFNLKEMFCYSKHKMNKLLLLFILLWEIGVYTQVKGYKVSFFGASYIAMPLQEAKISTNIRLRFRTYQENSLIMLAAGRTDYSLLSLEDGRVKFNFKIDDYVLELWTPKKVKFNDLQWHDISIQRYETNMTMQVDQHFIRKTIPIRIAELNIHFGVFLGGFGDFSESYLNSIENYRGCISDVFYNNINVFKRAKEKTSHVSSVKVSWICSTEFDADEHQSISFIDDDSYVLLAKPMVQTGESWKLELRTIEPMATLLYNSGSDFLGLEIVDGKIRLLAGKGSNAVELISDRSISDGKWHNITINYSPIIVELLVDDFVQSAQFANGSANIIELSEEYYIGGIASETVGTGETGGGGGGVGGGTIGINGHSNSVGLLVTGDYRKKKAIARGLRSIDKNFKGCMKNIHIDNQIIGFPHMKVTQNVAPECIWKYPCIEKPPCILSSSCQQYGVEDFICYCDQAYCLRANYTDKYKVFTRTDLPNELEILSISPIQLLEGDSIFLSTLVIDVLIDYTKLGIMESGVIFHIVQPPKYGKINILSYGGGGGGGGGGSEDSYQNGTSSAQNSKVFSLIDLSTDKVKYTHNGLEHFSDHMTMDLQLMSPNNREPIPEIFEGRHRFVLHANVTPVNDPPILTIPTNRILRVTQGIPKIITTDLLTADDPDSLPETLMYTIIPASSTTSGVSDGSQEYHNRFGNIEVMGKISSKFTQADINNGDVTYLVNTQGTPDDSSFELAIQVSDGMETSPTVFLPVSILPLQLRMINNTGLVLIHKSSALLTPWNLSFISNSDDDNVDVKYHIVQPPQFGNIQKLRTVDASWISVDSFTSNQILLGHIRYVHNNEFPIHDEFKFTASFGPITTIKYDFRIIFTKLKIGIQIQNSLQINGSKETILSAAYLFHQTTPLPTFTKNIIYTVLKPPKYGLIYIDGHPEYAKEMDSFTQYDIDKQLIRYRTHLTCYSSFVDNFHFLITVPECDDVQGSIKIIFNPYENLSKILSYQTRERIYVEEGDRQLLTRKNFEVLFNKFNYLNFTLSIPPNHGTLCSLDQKQKHLQNLIDISSFSLESLYLGDIYYCHDDSESETDKMSFLILSDYQRDFQYVCEIMANITLVNDNPPESFVNDVFHVVRNESKVISKNILRFIDPDINTNDSYILFRNLSMTNGEFYKSGVLTDSFTQDDINEGYIIFRHINSDFGVVNFVVTDGQHEITGQLDVQASDPFIKIAERNATIVQEGKFVLIRKQELAIETNLNSKPDEIEYRVIGDPNYGVVKILRRKFNGTSLPKAANITSSRNFTQLDVEKERVIYWNIDVASMDKIRYRVSTKGIWAEGEILIRIYPAAYWDLLQIRRNQTLYVEESTSVIISRDILEIVHPNISPGDITYLVTTSPQHGYLEIQSITSDDEYNSIFDQSTINAEKMFYIQAGVNQSTDYFTFDVTNGITWLRGLMLKIIIIPENLYIQIRNVSVEEGKSLRLSADDMIPYSEYYVGKILEYKIIQQPSFGYVNSGKSKVNRFTCKQLEAGNVQYVHDGSENDTDIMKLIAITRNKESIPFDLVIFIIPINDEIPQIITNTGLQMWIGGRAAIRSTDLAAQDYDTSPEYLSYLLLQVIGGFVALNDLTPAIVLNFTQKEINTNQIFFYHDPNYLNGQISFVVTDGAHNTTEHTLQITANPVILEMLKNENLHVFPLTRKQILPEQLTFRCSDQDRDVKFKITIPPQTGRIIYENSENGSTIECQEFTQNDVNMGRIYYEHTHSMIELKSNDSFYFDVSAKLATNLIDQIFHIQISVSSGGLLRFLPVQRLHLNEGDVTPIKLDLSKVLEYLEIRAGIQSPELYIDSYRPEFGVIEYEADGLRNLTRFTYNDFQMEKIFYHHDHSDTIEDKIRMSVYLVQGQIFLCNLTIPVIINPVNDHPFELRTRAPQMTIVEGENRTITRDELLTVDPDTTANMIIYDIVSPPTLGSIVKLSDDGIGQDILIYGNQFSQLDIDENRIQYVQTGAVQSTKFYFKVSDGKYNPAYEFFSIQVYPITIGPGVKDEIVMVEQGSNLGGIETKHFPIETNVNQKRLAYNITENPKAGVILMDSKAVQHFNQKQLNGHKISYMQTDMNRSNDNFKVNVYVIDTTHSTQIDVKIIVEPFIKINGISLISGDKIRLTSTFDPDHPMHGKLNKYNPKIVIIKKPEHGKIRKIIRGSGTGSTGGGGVGGGGTIDGTTNSNLPTSTNDPLVNDKDINTFTYKELKSGIVYFIARTLPDDALGPINDYFEYIIYIKSVQPGQGFVPIEIHKINTNLINNDLNNPVDGVNVSSYPTFSINYIVIISMIALMIVLVIIMIILIKCRAATSSERLKTDSIKDYPPPLPRPPDFMGLNNHMHHHQSVNNTRLYSSSDGGDSIPVTGSSTPLPILSSIPNCKIIPIGSVGGGGGGGTTGGIGGIDDSESDEMMDVNGIDAQQLSRNYPYGDENDEEWSSFGEVNYSSIGHPQQQQQQQQLTQQQRTNPLLRRNQYWV